MGAQQTPNTDPNQAGLSFLVGADNVHVLVLKPQDLAQRNSIIDTVLKLSSLRNSYQTVYLAAPRLLGATIDAAIFRAHGIGLLFFDERRIDEAVAPQPLQATRPQAAQPAQDPGLVSELATLKAMYFEMERNMTQLRDDLRNLHDAPRSGGFAPQLSQPAQPVPPEHVFAPNIIQNEALHPYFNQVDPPPPRGGSSGALPSYFTNNPWLEVLSKRGRSENGLLAG
jgi:hypothetical protein